MLVRVTRNGWTVVLTIPDEQMEAVIESANRHFGTTIQDPGSEAQSHGGVYAGQAAGKASGANGKGVARRGASVTRYRGE